jgi:hypothetical protein
MYTDLELGLRRGREEHILRVYRILYSVVQSLRNTSNITTLDKGKDGRQKQKTKAEMSGFKLRERNRQNRQTIEHQ